MENSLKISEKQLKEREEYYFAGVDKLPAFDQTELVIAWQDYVKYLHKENLISHER